MNDINDLVIKQEVGKLHRWKTWEPNTPFAPSLDVSFYIDNLQSSIVDDLLSLIRTNNLGSYDDDVWKTYNIFSYASASVKTLSNFIWSMYSQYCDQLQVESLSKDQIWIRGWAIKLENDQGLKMHSHSLHENTFLSGNISLTQNNTTTDYWIPLFSLYHGPFMCENIPGKICLFPSWVQHGVNPNQSGSVRYSVGFDMFTEHTMNYIHENRIGNSEIQNIILLSKKFSDI